MIFQLFAIIGITVFLFLGILEQEACAYLDLGAGSYIFQMVIAFAIGGLYAVKLFWNKILLFIRNFFKKVKNEQLNK